MHHFLVLGVWWIIPCFLLFTLAAASGEISINCGSTGISAEVDGREWIGDKQHPYFKIHGSSTRSSVISAAPVPYETARISRSQFSYIFHVNSGQTFIRLHFNPTSYHGYERYEDLFTVEAGQFTLLSNFSASITADALSVSYFVKEFCIVIEENQPLSITFSPASDHSQHTYVFINGIEIISLPESLSCSHTGDIGVQVVGQKSIVYIDNDTALEVVHRRNLNRASVSSGDDFRRMFGRWTTSLDKKVNKVNNITWRIPVDVGFRYLVRLHFCELGLKLTESGQKNFLFLIDHVIATTDTEIFHQRVDKHSLLYMNYVVIAKGRKQEGKRDILISLQSKENFIHRHGPLEGFEIFKLSNHDNSLASPNPLPLTRESPSLLSNFHLPIPGGRNSIATVLITVICLVNIVVHILRETCESIFPEEENKPSTKTTRLCRCFSLAEIQSATKNFNDEFIIGKGGFGIVYKGIIIDNGKKTVAFKRLKPESKQGKREFCTEIETLSELRHINLVSLIGYCNEQGEMILVYAYMPNGTLADHLYKLVRKNKKFSSLTWEERLKICIGAGRGLDYLHTGQGVIHRDVKASNILLDETFVAKVSDFGLAKSEKEMQLQSQESSNPKGTFGYFDPDYFRTSNLTTKSDTYSFGVVLLEVLCGRPAVDPLVEKDMRSLTMWARDNIDRGEVDKIVAPSLIGDISPDSFKTFLGIVIKCLHDEPKRRPTIAYVVINLEMALEQQNDKWSSPNEIASVSDFLPYTDQTRRESTKSLLHNELSGVTQPLPRTDRTLMSTQDLTMLSSNMQNTTSLMKDGTSSRMVNAEPLFGKKEGKKNIMSKLSRLLPWDTTTWKKTKQSKNYGGSSISEPMSEKTSNETSSRFNGFYPIQLLSKEGVGNDSISTPNFRIFSFSELNAATKNFRADAVLGQGGFGIVYKGCLEEKSRNGNGSVSFIAIKRLNPTSMQGFKEWLSEVTFLGKLSHPNLVKLLGYCSDNQELLLVYEFIEKGSLEHHLYQKSSAVQTLPWNIRLKILIGAARGLAYLHTLDSPIIYRDLKPSNILLDGLYNVKLSDFGLAKSGPSGDSTHVSTRVMGTVGYVAPEYAATGHLYMESDVYSFGVLLIEMLTGLRAFDINRPPSQKNLIEWIEPQLNDKKKLNRITDAWLEGRYPLNSPLKMYHLARNCLEVDPKKRPSMSEVVETLERIDLINEKPRELRVRFINQSGQDGRESLK